jgi:hypothetical protein
MHQQTQPWMRCAVDPPECIRGHARHIFSSIHGCMPLARARMWARGVTGRLQHFVHLKRQLTRIHSLQIDGDIQGWPDVATWPNSTFRLCPTTPYEAKDPIFVLKKESLLWTRNSSGLKIRSVTSLDRFNGAYESWAGAQRRDA